MNSMGMSVTINYKKDVAASKALVATAVQAKGLKAVTDPDDDDIQTVAVADQAAAKALIAALDTVPNITTKTT